MDGLDGDRPSAAAPQPSTLTRDGMKVQFSGMPTPVASLEGSGKVIGALYPATHILTVSRGVFCKGLGIADLPDSFLALAVTAPIPMATGVALLRKQEH